MNTNDTNQNETSVSQSLPARRYEDTPKTEGFQQTESLAQAIERARLTALYGPVYNTAEATDKYEFISFLAPFVLVREKTGEKRRGTLEFQHMERFYFLFVPEDTLP